MQTKKDSRPETSAFTPSSLAKVVAQINASFPEQLTRDWRNFVQGAFALEPEQKESLEQVPEMRVKEIQEFFAEAAGHVKKGGMLHARIIKRPPEKRTESAVHELHMDIESPAITPKVSVVIAHCDAHCRHWGWGRG